MEQSKIRLIAEFMGWKSNVYAHLPNKVYVNVGEDNEIGKCLSSFYYHLLWNDLMPVVEKICQLKFNDGENISLRTFGMLHESGQFMVRFNGHSLFIDEDLLTATFNAVVDVLEKFNH